MAMIKTTTTVEYPVGEFKSMVAELMFAGKRNIKVEFLIQEVGGDPLDRFPGHNEVTKVRVSYEGTPAG
jgi:hypothetical protein